MNEQAKAVERMFSGISHRYDLANEVLSLGLHRLWRRAAVRHSGVAEGARVLDCASGTGDLALAFKRAVKARGVVAGTDFCAPMLEGATAKAARAGLDVRFSVADALDLPQPAASFDVAAMAFGIRNVTDPVRCLRELSRVVRPGGRVVVLEFGQPRGLFGALYRFYGRHVMPRVGGWLTGQPQAYEYLPRTAAAFPAGDAFLALMKSAGGFRSCQAHPLTFGVAYVYVGVVGP